MKNSGILQQGKNCWRLASCGRAAFLVDGEAYFWALARTLLRARQCVYILGWDIDSRIRLVRDGEQSELEGLPTELGAFLNGLVARRRGLHIYVLDWDFAMLYALEREPLPIFKFGWGSHKRLHFKMDDKHPVGASHHQKLVVVDDQVAFCGGLDLASARWDTSEHTPQEPRRRDNGKTYGPFHDVQLMVDGEAARALGELARERWRRATGRRLKSPRQRGNSPWPESVEADLERATVGILRTDPGCEGSTQVCEVKDFYLDAVAAAQSFIYIENQYFTAQEIGRALERRLAEESGPEVLLVLPRECSGWLEQGTMGVLQARLLQRLQQVDRHGRLKVYYPTREGLDPQVINVHAKVLVVDDKLVRIGSSNLNNRSMGLDSECDLAIEAGEEPRLRRGIAAFRNRLLAEHLGMAAARVEETLGARGSLIETVEQLRGGQRSLAPLEPQVDEWLNGLIPDAGVIDPERPVSFSELVEQLAPVDLEAGAPRGGRSKKGLGFGLLLAAALGLAALWRWSPLGEWLDVETLSAWGLAIRDSPLAPLVTLAAYVAGGFVLVPVTLLILASALVFGPVAGFCYSLAGALASGLASYALGRLLGRDRVRNLAGGRLNRISRALAKKGLLAVAAIRLVPVAPFTVVNLVAGASHIRPRDFTLGTLLGLAPGVLAITLFEEGLVSALKNPGSGDLLILGGIGAGAALGGWLLWRRLRRKKRLPGDEPHE
ncbi:phospholipase [Desulfuromonas versatilis]|uniref:Phospholipase n=1 Tax=Desulfuromonas versatilis TaxID=2802975 RepID=A0ABM8HU86_9BACT|nr:VTT domain-containing protein [Desulfuromonas versatilis]BCR04281.1 phospholipase [Desulfuromonas versatilis]